MRGRVCHVLSAAKVVRSRGVVLGMVSVAQPQEGAKDLPVGQLPLNYDNFLQSLYRLRDPALAVENIDKMLVLAKLKPEQQQSLRKQREQFLQYQQENKVKVGGQWISREESQRLQQQSRDELTRGLDLLQQFRWKEALQRIEKASQIYPESYEPDFILGMLFSARGLCIPARAEKYFDRTVRRNPMYPPGLNNLALAQVKLRKYDEALKNWQRMYVHGMVTTEMLQNVGRVTDSGLRGMMPVPPSVLRAYKEFYDLLERSRSEEVKPYNSQVGWLYMPLVETAQNQTPGELPQPSALESFAATDPLSSTGILESREYVHMGSGTAFAIAAGLALTNKHVVFQDDLGLADAVVLRADGDREKHVACVVHLHPELDMCLLKARTLQADPLPIRKAPLQRGESIAVFGYPREDILGRQLKITQGIVTAPPHPDNGNYLIMDAQAAPGNSGGPIIDTYGQVCGVLTAISQLKHMQISLGIPSDQVHQYLLERDFPHHTLPVEPTVAEDWTAIDRQVSRSIFLAQVYYRADKLRLHDVMGTSAPERIDEYDRFRKYEDISCTLCNGLGMIRCPNKQCASGKVTLMEWNTRIVEQSPGFFAPVMTNSVSYGRCHVCSGAGFIRCGVCRGGIDPRLR
ncbi:MAG: hypothetical protein KatS3mg114_1407 [Planctomycetaceae bacterium]|nr:MAG: hypothetical protein KatS3mg114_1407 [Planctomycetaceae bacterium]